MADFDPSARAAPLIVNEKRGSVDVLFGVVAAILGAALARGHFGAETTKGRVVMWIVLGGLWVLWVLGWIYMRRHPARLEITHDAIALAHRGGVRKQVLPRTTGTLYIRMHGGRHPQPYLRTDDTEEAIHILTFDRAELVRACVGAGWHFGDASDWQRPSS